MILNNFDEKIMGYIQTNNRFDQRKLLFDATAIKFKWNF